MCEGCAFRTTCDTWKEPRNRVVSQICAAGPLPFACHNNLDWKAPLAHCTPLRQLAGERQVLMCDGWKRAVRSRVWPEDPVLRMYQRMLARDALTVFDAFYAGGESTANLQKQLTALGAFYRGPRAWQIERMMQR